MNCCNANGQCDQGKDCPIRKQRIKEVNDAYVKGFSTGQEDPLEDLAATLKGLIAGLVVIVGVVMVVMAWWHK